jgi:hypothetical protein
MPFQETENPFGPTTSATGTGSPRGWALKGTISANNAAKPLPQTFGTAPSVGRVRLLNLVVVCYPRKGDSGGSEENCLFRGDIMPTWVHLASAAKAGQPATVHVALVNHVNYRPACNASGCRIARVGDLHPGDRILLTVRGGYVSI